MTTNVIFHDLQFFFSLKADAANYSIHILNTLEVTQPLSLLTGFIIWGLQMSAGHESCHPNFGPIEAITSKAFFFLSDAWKIKFWIINVIAMYEAKTPLLWSRKNTLCHQHHKEEETACCVELLGSLSWIGNVAGSVWAHSWRGVRTYCKPDPVNTAAGQSRDSGRIWY